MLWTHFQEPTWEKMSCVKDLEAFKKWKKKWDGKEVTEGEEEEESLGFGDWDSDEEDEDEEEEIQEVKEELKKQKGKLGKKELKGEEEEEDTTEEEGQEPDTRKRKGFQWVSYDTLKRRKVT